VSQVVTKVALFGASGRMGRAIDGLVATNDTDKTSMKIVARIDANSSVADIDAALSDFDVFIDFSHASFAETLAAAALRHRRAGVVGTTGMSDNARAAFAVLSQQVPLVVASNFSVGVAVLQTAVARIARAVPKWDAEIVEVHHHHKKDAPSGTALTLAQAIVDNRTPDPTLNFGRSGHVGERIAGEVGIHAVRGGDVVGEHTVSFFGQGERIELIHKATNREIFAQGALVAARWLQGRAPGMYDMRNVVDEHL